MRKRKTGKKISKSRIENKEVLENNNSHFQIIRT